MIINDSLFAEIGRLYAAFDSHIEHSKAAAFLCKIAPLLEDEKQFSRVVNEIISMGVYPTLKQLVAVAKIANPKSNQLLEIGKIIECTCGASFLVRKSDLDGLAGPIDCPGKFYGICDRSFSTEEILSSFKVPIERLPMHRLQRAERPRWGLDKA